MSGTMSLGVFVGADGRVTANAEEQVHVLRCLGCKQKTLVIETRESPLDDYRGTLWWPPPGAGSLDPSVPKLVADAYDEGVRCLSVTAPHAAVTMLRSALAQIVLDKGSPDAQSKVKTNLSTGIVQWHKDGLNDMLAEWAQHARIVGNAGAHQEAYEPVSMVDAEDLRQLVHQFITVVYVTPARIAQARAAGAGAKRP